MRLFNASWIPRIERNKIYSSLHFIGENLSIAWRSFPTEQYNTYLLKDEWPNLDDLPMPGFTNPFLTACFSSQSCCREVGLMPAQPCASVPRHVPVTHQPAPTSRHASPCGTEKPAMCSWEKTGNKPTKLALCPGLIPTWGPFSEMQ